MHVYKESLEIPFTGGIGCWTVRVE